MEIDGVFEEIDSSAPRFLFLKQYCIGHYLRDLRAVEFVLQTAETNVKAFTRNDIIECNIILLL